MPIFQRTIAEGIEMRQFKPGDAAAVYAVVERNREYLREWLPWVDFTHSVNEVRHFIAQTVEQFKNGLGPNAGIWLDGAFVGSIGCHTIDMADRSCCIGYWIEAGHQRKGTVTKCCALLLDHLFNEMKLHRVVIRCAPGNVRSRAIPQRLGFTYEAVLREAQGLNGKWVDLEIWSMLEQDWRKTP